MSEKEKWCPRCCEHIPLRFFYGDRCQPDGYAKVCKDCHKAYRARHYSKAVQENARLLQSWGRVVV